MVDYGEAPLKIAGEIAKKEKARITTIKGDAKNLPFPGGYFDFVYLFSVNSSAATLMASM